MYLKSRANGDLVEILDLTGLFDPFQGAVEGRFHAGEEIGDASQFQKADMVFPSGEDLPLCWTDGKYREKGLTG